MFITSWMTLVATSASAGCGLACLHQTGEPMAFFWAWFSFAYALRELMGDDLA